MGFRTALLILAALVLCVAVLGSSGKRTDGSSETSRVSTLDSDDAMLSRFHVSGGSVPSVSRRAGAWQSAEMALAYLGSTGWQVMTHVEVSGDYAYCALQFGLMIVDVSDPDVPTVVSQVYLASAAAAPNHLTVAGDYAFLAYQGADLTVIASGGSG